MAPRETGSKSTAAGISQSFHNSTAICPKCCSVQDLSRAVEKNRQQIFFS